jgi:hypothetical protein
MTFSANCTTPQVTNDFYGSALRAFGRANL